MSYSGYKHYTMLIRSYGNVIYTAVRYPIMFSDVNNHDASNYFIPN